MPLSIKLYLPCRPWQEEEAEAAPPHPRPRPAQDPVSHPSVPRNHRFRRRQGSDARQGRPPRLWISPPQEAAVQERAP